jgi:hypothetical protein
MCSGVLVAERLVLTARHCAHDLEPSEIEVAFDAGEPGSRVLIGARLAAVHPVLDVMALTLDEAWDASIEVEPLPIAEVLPTGLGRGSLVQVGGFGADADGVVDRRGFLVEEVYELEPDALIVSAEGLGGACFGDSGGPLLARADDGSVRTLGLLAFGAASCFEKDHYTRVDGLADWAAEAGLDLRASNLPSGTHDRLGPEGRCFDGRAVWFEAGALRANVCSDGDTCGWSSLAQGYRCVAAEEDTCRGIDDVGTCHDGIAVNCVRGRIEENPCAVCGFDCRRSPKTGGPACL